MASPARSAEAATDHARRMLHLQSQQLETHTSHLAAAEEAARRRAADEAALQAAVDAESRRFAREEQAAREEQRQVRRRAEAHGLVIGRRVPMPDTKQGGVAMVEVAGYEGEAVAFIFPDGERCRIGDTVEEAARESERARAESGEGMALALSSSPLLRSPRRDELRLAGSAAGEQERAWAERQIGKTVTVRSKSAGGHVKACIVAHHGRSFTVSYVNRRGQTMEKDVAVDSVLHMLEPQPAPLAQRKAQLQREGRQEAEYKAEVRARRHKSRRDRVTAELLEQRRQALVLSPQHAPEQRHSPRSPGSSSSFESRDGSFAVTRPSPRQRDWRGVDEDPEALPAFLEEQALAYLYPHLVTDHGYMFLTDLLATEPDELNDIAAGAGLKVAELRRLERALGVLRKDHRHQTTELDYVWPPEMGFGKLVHVAKTATKPQPTTVGALLADHDLTQFSAAIRDAEFVQLDDLRDADDAEIDQLIETMKRKPNKMKKPTERRFRKALDSLRSGAPQPLKYGYTTVDELIEASEAELAELMEEAKLTRAARKRLHKELDARRPCAGEALRPELEGLPWPALFQRAMTLVQDGRIDRQNALVLAEVAAAKDRAALIEQMVGYEKLRDQEVREQARAEAIEKLRAVEQAVQAGVDPDALEAIREADDPDAVVTQKAVALAVKEGVDAKGVEVIREATDPQEAARREMAQAREKQQEEEAQQQQLLRTSMSAARAHRAEVIAERDRLKAEWDAKKEKVVVTIKERGRPLGLELDQHSFPGINGVDPDGEIHRLNSDIGAKEGWKLHSMAAPGGKKFDAANPKQAKPLPVDSKSPKWQPDNTVKRCSNYRVCKTRSFSGNMFSSGKHHCRDCGQVFCGACTRWQADFQGQKLRVCRECFETREDKSGLSDAFRFISESGRPLQLTFSPPEIPKLPPDLPEIPPEVKSELQPELQPEPEPEPEGGGMLAGAAGALADVAGSPIGRLAAGFVPGGELVRQGVEAGGRGVQAVAGGGRRS